jgi:hypothetical protein
MTEIGDAEKGRLLADILNSPEFRDSKRYQELLQYLVEKTSTVGSPKEMEIAHDLFGKDSTFDPSSDPLIRSYISNLRKKLEHYYFTTENDFAFKIEIPKGQYLITYVPADRKTGQSKRALFRPSWFLVIIGLLVLALIYQYFTHRTAPIEKMVSEVAPNPIWNEFLAEDASPVLIVLGDYLVLAEKGKQIGRTFLRVPQINSENDLREHTANEPEKYSQYQISEITFIGAGASVGLTDVLQVFGTQVNKVSIKLSSELKWDDLDNHNIVYIGTFKSLYKLDTLFSRTNIRYKLNPNTLEVLSKDKTVLKSFVLDWHGGNYQRDYSVVLKLSGRKNNPMLFLSGFSEVGVMDAIKTATDPALMSRISASTGKTIDRTPSLFELVSEAEGVRYTVLRSRIEYHEILPTPGGGQKQ